MNRRPLWQITVTVAVEAEDAVCEMMERVFARPATVYAREETSMSLISVFCNLAAHRDLLRRAIHHSRPRRTEP